MTSLQIPTGFDGVRPQTHQGVYTSPHESPRLQRPSSQGSMHYPPPTTANYPPVIHGDSHPLSAFPAVHAQPNYRTFQPTALSLPIPHQSHHFGGYPSTAPPMPFFPGTNGANVDYRGGQPMIRTISHAHPMNSATDQTASSRYSPSPHSASHPLEGPPTAGAYPMSFGPPSFNVQDTEERHVNPAIFNSSYPMSRSTSGASDAAGDTTRLLTPHYDHRHDHLSTEQELRKVSDSLGRSSSRFYQGAMGGYDTHGLQLGPHPQPDGFYYGRSSAGEHFTLSAERGDSKTFIPIEAETDYERERAQQMEQNKRLLEEVGLGGGTSYVRSRNSSMTRKPSTTMRKRILTDEHPVRVSNRIASMSRNVSYADLDGGPLSDQEEEDEEEYASDPEMEDDDFRPPKRTKGAKRSYGRQVSYGQKASRKVELSLYGLLQVYEQIPHMFPLFYYTLNNDLTINSDSVPLIGSIPSTCTPLEKAETLRQFFHRGRRVLGQLDAFTARCDRKYDGPEEKWPELDYHTRVAVRDVRRKIVERCENYKYTRRDILDKTLGKNKWQPIEQGLVEWKVGMSEGDPANDLANVTLTLPTPPPALYAAQQAQAQRQASQSLYPGRSIRPFPSRQRVASAAPRTVSVTMGSPGHTQGCAVGLPGTQSYSYAQAPPPMYGEDQVALSVQMPGLPASSSSVINSSHAEPSTSGLTPLPSSWDDRSRGVKRSRSEDSDESNEGEATFGDNFA